MEYETKRNGMWIGNIVKVSSRRKYKRVYGTSFQCICCYFYASVYSVNDVWRLTHIYYVIRIARKKTNILFLLMHSNQNLKISHWNRVNALKCSKNNGEFVIMASRKKRLEIVVELVKIAYTKRLGNFPL